jgi:hypothetical protein
MSTIWNGATLEKCETSNKYEHIVIDIITLFTYTSVVELQPQLFHSIKTNIVLIISVLWLSEYDAPFKQLRDPWKSGLEEILHISLCVVRGD